MFSIYPINTYSTLDANIMFQDGISCIKGDLIVSLVTVGKAKIKVEGLYLYSKKELVSSFHFKLLRAWPAVKRQAIWTLASFRIVLSSLTTIYLEVRKNQRFLNLFPDDSSHLITILRIKESECYSNLKT